MVEAEESMALLQTRKLLLGILVTTCLVVYLYCTFPTFNKDGHFLPELEDQHVSIEDVMHGRRQLVKDVCRKYSLGKYAQPHMSPAFVDPPTPAYSIFYIDRVHKLAWCPLYKAASTTWMYNFGRLGGLSENYLKHSKEQPNVVARKVIPELPPEIAKEAFTYCLKFIIVRHPFERLLSAYRDKLENVRVGLEHGVEHFYKKYGQKIVAKYRKDNNTLRYPPGVLEGDYGIPPPKGVEPTFPEFVSYLCDLDVVERSDDHWIPFFLHATPCWVDYDVIAKMETLRDDQMYIIRKANLTRILKPTWKHLTKGKSTGDVARKYFQLLTKEQVRRLYMKYQLDFELFGYEPDKYLDFAGA